MKKVIRLHTKQKCIRVPNFASELMGAVSSTKAFNASTISLRQQAGQEVIIVALR